MSTLPPNLESDFCSSYFLFRDLLCPLETCWRRRFRFTGVNTCSQICFSLHPNQRNSPAQMRRSGLITTRPFLVGACCLLLQLIDTLLSFWPHTQTGALLAVLCSSLSHSNTIFLFFGLFNGWCINIALIFFSWCNLCSLPDYKSSSSLLQLVINCYTSPLTIISICPLSL